MNDSQGEPRGGISRRGFLAGTGAATAVAGVTSELAPATAAQPGAAPAHGPGPVLLQLTVNGQKVNTNVEPRVTLLDALRNYLDVTGCKRVCDRGTCGACTVTVNGRTVYSCTMLALEARGMDIRTAENLGGAKLDAVPAAFVDNDAQQCGFCTPGFVVSLRAALDKNPNATPEQVEAALAGNICRCGTYEQMRHAIVQLCKKGG
ncbi:MAG: (2Fe-2S)-binding protein [Planctomycetia bacterium]|nr:(2Fe-2S)-binding protein [Planctomycetia bacterium]